MQKIVNLHEWQPIKLHDKDGNAAPASVDELEDVLQALAQLDMEDRPMTK